MRESIADRSTEAFLTQHGYAIARSVLSPQECRDVIDGLPAGISDNAGMRGLLSLPWCRWLALRVQRDSLLRSVIPSEYVAVHCTYFTKSQTRNWLVSIHQDLSIPVAERVAGDHLHSWSRKDEGLFVQAPVELLERLIAVRIHLDPCLQEDGPLRVIPGSHRHGVIDHDNMLDIKKVIPTVDCIAFTGDALIMRPLLLHMSSKATGTSSRRVLHFLFGPRELPHGLLWPTVC